MGGDEEVLPSGVMRLINGTPEEKELQRRLADLRSVGLPTTPPPQFGPDMDYLDKAEKCAAEANYLLRQAVPDVARAEALTALGKLYLALYTVPPTGAIIGSPDRGMTK